MTAVPPRKATRIGQPFENNGIWIAMFQIGDGIPYAVEVSAPKQITERGESNDDR